MTLLNARIYRKDLIGRACYSEVRIKALVPKDGITVLDVIRHPDVPRLDRYWVLNQIDHCEFRIPQEDQVYLGEQIESYVRDQMPKNVFISEMVLRPDRIWWWISVARLSDIFDVWCGEGVGEEFVQYVLDELEFTLKGAYAEGET